MIKINVVIIWDTNIPLSIDKFSKEFAKCKIISLINFFFRYNQVKLDKCYKNMIAIITPQGLIKQITLF